MVPRSLAALLAVAFVSVNASDSPQGGLPRLRGVQSLPSSARPQGTTASEADAFVEQHPVGVIREHHGQHSHHHRWLAFDCVADLQVFRDAANTSGVGNADFWSSVFESPEFRRSFAEGVTKMDDDTRQLWEESLLSTVSVFSVQELLAEDGLVAFATTVGSGTAGSGGCHDVFWGQALGGQGTTQSFAVWVAGMANEARLDLEEQVSVAAMAETGMSWTPIWQQRSEPLATAARAAQHRRHYHYVGSSEAGAQGGVLVNGKPVDFRVESAAETFMRELILSSSAGPHPGHVPLTSEGDGPRVFPSGKTGPTSLLPFGCYFWGPVTRPHATSADDTVSDPDQTASDGATTPAVAAVAKDDKARSPPSSAAVAIKDPHSFAAVRGGWWVNIGIGRGGGYGSRWWNRRYWGEDDYWDGPGWNRWYALGQRTAISAEDAAFPKSPDSKYWQTLFTKEAAFRGLVGWFSEFTLVERRAWACSVYGVEAYCNDASDAASESEKSEQRSPSQGADVASGKEEAGIVGSVAEAAGGSPQEGSAPFWQKVFSDAVLTQSFRTWWAGLDVEERRSWDARMEAVAGEGARYDEKAETTTHVLASWGGISIGGITIGWGNRNDGYDRGYDHYYDHGYRGGYRYGGYDWYVLPGGNVKQTVEEAKVASNLPDSDAAESAVGDGRRLLHV